MKPVRPIFLGDTAEPVVDSSVLGIKSERKIPISSLSRGTGGGQHLLSVSRWRPSEEERKHITAGGDVILQVIHIGSHPALRVRVCDPDKSPKVTGK